MQAPRNDSANRPASKPGDSASRPTAPGIAAGPGTSDPRAILSSIGEVVYSWNLLTDRLEWGPNVREVLPVGDRGDLDSGRDFAQLVSAETGVTRYDAVLRSSETDTGSGVVYQCHYAIKSSTAERAPVIAYVEDVGRWFAGADGRPAHAHGALRVVTARYEAERRRAMQSRYDPLTGALNRAEFAGQLGRMFHDKPASRTSFAMLLVSIDGLAHINRNFGYDVGDEIICAVAARLRSCMRSADLLSRYAGNKFALLLGSCDDEQMGFAAARFIDAVTGTAFELPGGQKTVSLRAGGVTAPRHAGNVQQLFQHAEEALEAARSSATRFYAYEPSLHVESQRLHVQAMSDLIIDSLNTQRIAIAMQPVVDAKTSQPVFHEALLRLLREDGTIMSPASILPVAEKTGLVRLIDRRVMDLALAEIEANPALHISVNVSGVTLHDPEWLNHMRAALTLKPEVAGHLIVEITESTAVEDVVRTRAIVDEIKAIGARVAMDDFGAGHTSFRNLRQLGFDMLKIDGAFVQNATRSPDDRFFVRTLVDLARHLGIPIVAEWVEDSQTARLLAEWGVDFFQGTLFGEPELVERPAAYRIKAA